MLFDTHAHYDDEAFDEDRDRLLAGLRDQGIENVVNIGASMKTSQNTLSLTEQYPFIYGAVGVHPSETAELNDRLMDYYWDEPDRETQEYWFVRQLNLAKEVNLPVVIHSRDAARDTLDIIKEHHGGKTGGVIHCFSYGTELAGEYLSMGFYRNRRCGYI